MKSKSLSSALHLILTSSLPSITHCYILHPGCAPYIDDIRRGPQDYQYSMQAAQAALAPQEATNSHNVILDWTGLLTPLFPGLTGTRDTTLHDSLVILSSFDQTAYHSIDNAIETAWNPLLENVSTPLLPDRRYLDSTTLFVCDPTTFIKDVIAVEDPGSEDEPGGTDEYIHIWYDTATDEIYRDLTFDEELCPPGVPTRLAYHQGRGFGQADDEEDYPD